MKKLIMLAAAFVLASALCAEPVVRGFYGDQNFQASYNNLGAQLGTKIFYRMPLIQKEGILWESTKIDLGIINNLSPAYDSIGCFVDIQPIAIFDLVLKAQFTGYYQALGFGFQDLSSYGSEFDSSSRSSLTQKDTTGYVLSATPTLQFAFGRFAFTDSFAVSYFNVDGGSGYFYEAIAGVPLAKSDFELNNDAYALYLIGKGIYVGLNDSILEVPGSGYMSHTLQAIGIISRPISDTLSFYAALLAGVYLDDRYLQGEGRIAGQAGISFSL